MKYNIKTILSWIAVLAGLQATAQGQIVTRASALTSGSHQMEFGGLMSWSSVGQTPTGLPSPLAGFESNAGFWPIVAGDRVGPLADVVAVDDTAETLEGQSILVQVTLNDKNPAPGGLTVTSVTQPLNGSAEVDSDSTVRYTPDADFAGKDQFTYLVSNDLGSTGQATVLVTVSRLGDTPAIPILLDPQNGVEMPQGEVTWIWRSSDGAQSFRYQLARDPNFADLESDTLGLQDTTLTSTLTDPGVYYWRVGADNQAGFSGFSQGNVFSIAPSVSTEGFDEVPAEFELRQNYPNPFNPGAVGTAISYQLPQSVHVHLAVYDVFGKEVATLVHDRRRSGVYTTSFNASGLASGTYIYRISAGNWTQARTMVVLR